MSALACTFCVDFGSRTDCSGPAVCRYVWRNPFGNGEDYESRLCEKHKDLVLSWTDRVGEIVALEDGRA